MEAIRIIIYLDRLETRFTALKFSQLPSLLNIFLTMFLDFQANVKSESHFKVAVSNVVIFQEFNCSRYSCSLSRRFLLYLFAQSLFAVFYE